MPTDIMFNKTLTNIRHTNQYCQNRNLGKQEGYFDYLILSRLEFYIDIKGDSCC